MTGVERLRRSNDLTQAELAEALGVTQASVSAWERGKMPSVKRAIKLAKFFNVPVDEVLREGDLQWNVNADSA